MKLHFEQFQSTLVLRSLARALNMARCLISLRLIWIDTAGLPKCMHDHSWIGSSEMDLLRYFLTASTKSSGLVGLH
jgi:hypothetical protein